LYLPWKKIYSVSASPNSSITAFDANTFKSKVETNNTLYKAIGEGGKVNWVRAVKSLYFDDPTYSMDLSYLDKDGTSKTISICGVTRYPSNFENAAAAWGFTVDTSVSNGIYSSNLTTSYRYYTKKITKLYGSVNGQTKLIFEDV